MGLSRRSIELFITDSLALARKGVLAIQRMESKTSAEDVRRFFHAVHSLKGTAAMVPGSEQVVAPLHRLEAKLTVGGSFESLAAAYMSWRDEALVALEESIRGLKGLHRQLNRSEIEETPAPGMDGSSPEDNTAGEEFCYFVGPSQEGSAERGFYIPVREIVSVGPECSQDVVHEGVLSKEGRWWRVVRLTSAEGGSEAQAQPRMLLWVRSLSPLQERVFQVESGYRVVGILTVEDAQKRDIPVWSNWMERESEKVAA